MLFKHDKLDQGGITLAKSKKDAVNKSQAIRDALEAHPEKSPSEIAEELAAKGLKVNAQYVSTIKSNAKSKGRKTKLVRRGRAAARRGNGDFGPIGAALQFIREAGGLENARHALRTIEEIQHAVR
jgi:hypothetical protein